MNHPILLTVLTAAPPTVTVFYVLLEYLNVFDRLTGRAAAVAGLARLRSPAGFPTSHLYDDEKDKRIFQQLKRRITKHTKNLPIREAFQTQKATLITTVGKPCLIEGVPPEWPQEVRLFYSHEHSVIVSFGTVREGGQEGAAFRACGLGELEGWLTQERDRRRLILGGVLVGLISLALIVIRLKLS